MTSPGSPSQFSGRSLRQKNKPEPPEPAGFLRGPVRPFPSVPSSPNPAFRAKTCGGSSHFTGASTPWAAGRPGRPGMPPLRADFAAHYPLTRYDPKDLHGVRRTRLLSMALGQDPRLSGFPSMPMPVGDSLHGPHSDCDAGQENKRGHGIQ